MKSIISNDSSSFAYSTNQTVNVLERIREEVWEEEGREKNRETKKEKKERERQRKIVAVAVDTVFTDSIIYFLLSLYSISLSWMRN